MGKPDSILVWVLAASKGRAVIRFLFKVLLSRLVCYAEYEFRKNGAVFFLVVAPTGQSEAIPGSLFIIDAAHL